MTDQQLSKWINIHLGPIITGALEKSGNIVYPVDLMGAMAQREVGFLISRFVIKEPGITVEKLSTLMKGDYSQRPGETEKKYHGFGFWQIDIKSFPDFVASGDWADPIKCCLKAINVLMAKGKYLADKLPGLSADQMLRANVAAYNCGEGNVVKAVINHLDIDTYTFSHDYSTAVWRYREFFRDGQS